MHVTGVVGKNLFQRLFCIALKVDREWAIKTMINKEVIVKTMVAGARLFNKNENNTFFFSELALFLIPAFTWNK